MSDTTTAANRFWSVLGESADVVADRMNRDSKFLEDLALYARKGRRDVRGRGVYGDLSNGPGDRSDYILAVRRGENPWLDR